MSKEAHWLWGQPEPFRRGYMAALKDARLQYERDGAAALVRWLDDQIGRIEAADRAGEQAP